MPIEKIRVAVLYGGRSGEHEISLISARNVIENLDPTLFEVIPIGVDKKGSWCLGEKNYKELACNPEKMFFNPLLLGKKSEQALVKTHSSSAFDVIFPAIHGTLCEDGTIQGLLESADIPYVGCGVLASAVGMDKDISKRLITQAGILTPDYLMIKRGEWDHHPDRFCELVQQKLQFPVFVKPANTGSSVGVHKVKNVAELIPAIQDAFQYDVKIVVEQGIDALELEVAILESLEYGQEPKASIVGEVRPTHEFYSYTAKYLDENGAELIIPSSISADLQEQVRATAIKIFKTLECEGMARVDLFLDKKTQAIYFNEVNTIPGFTKISMYPKLMAASNVPYSTLLTHLIQLAMSRHERKNKLKREYSPTTASEVSVA